MTEDSGMVDGQRAAGVLASAADLLRSGLGRLRQLIREAGRLLRQARASLEPLPAHGPEPWVAAGALFLERVHEEEAGSRRYRLYHPASIGGAPPEGLLVMLHGCTQTPEDFAVGTGMNRLAEAHRLVVVYPGQTQAHNGKACWNWFRPGHQRRGGGEPAILAGLARSVADEYGIPSGRVFVAGLSAGGAMASVLGAAYPDVFAAVGVHSGVPHGSARSILSALAVMRGKSSPADPAGLPVPLIVFHGDADTVVHPGNAERMAAAGRQTGAPRARRGVANGRAFSRWTDRGGAGAPALEYWVVEGAGHAWSGGNPEGSFSDAAGPDASAEMVRFFLDAGHSRPE